MRAGDLTDTVPRKVQVKRAAYLAGYGLSILPGQHGQYFNPANVEALAAEICATLGPPQRAGPE